MKLSEQQVADFNRDGYLKVDFGFDPAMLDQIRSQVEPLYEQDYRIPEFRSCRVQDAWRRVKPVRQLATHAAVAGALQQLFQRKPLPFQTLNFPMATTQLPHSDTIHFNCIPSGYMCGVWVALEDIDRDNGPLIYYPGSHLLQEFSMQDLGLGTGYGHYKGYEAAIQDIIRKHDLQADYGVMKKGGALIWHANLLHGGAPLNDPSRTRHSQVTHYYFEGCRYYTPMNSTEQEIAYRHPLWIEPQPSFAERIDKLKTGLRKFKQALRGNRTA